MKGKKTCQYKAILDIELAGWLKDLVKKCVKVRRNLNFILC